MKSNRRIGALARRVLEPRQIKRVRHWAAGLVSRVHLPLLNLFLVSSVFNSEKRDWYLERYAQFFAPLRSKRINLLEIGVGGVGNPNKGGGSLRMWSSYFWRGRVYGIDLYDKRAHDVPGRIRTFAGDQSDTEFLTRVAKEIGRIDIVIDDGSHINQHVVESCRCLFPLLADDGIYVIEDLQTSYWESYGGGHGAEGAETIMSFLKGLADGLNHTEFDLPSYEPTYFDKNVRAMFVCHNIAFLFKGDNRGRRAVLERSR